MDKENQENKKRNGFLRKLALWKKPTYQLKEENFLVETENLGTGLWRAIRMFLEYMHGFAAFKDIRNCITIFGSARFSEDSCYYQMARTVGYKLATAGFTVMTGGGPGIMEAANRGAKEGHGYSIACNIKIFNLEKPNIYVDKRITLRYFFVRKVMLTKYSSAYIFLPGGFGTLDELFEMATLIQTGKIHNFPIVLMGKEYWAPLVNFIEKTMLAQGTIKEEDLKRILVTDSADEALQHIKCSLAKIKI